VKKLIDTSYQKVKEMLTQNEDRLRNLAKILLEKETLEGEEVRKILGLPEKKKDA
jgi:cell division protease FtsH